MSVEEAAAAIHRTVKPRSLTKAIADKKLQAIKAGRTVLVTAGAVRAWLVTCETMPLPTLVPPIGSASQQALEAAERLRSLNRTGSSKKQG